MLSEPEIIDKVLASPKYRYVDRAVVSRIVRANVQRYGLKRAEDETKRLLHQVWGIYYGDGPKAAAVSDLGRLLARHASTKERLPYLVEIYDAIFQVTGRPETIADYGCGLNPLAFASLGLPFPRAYRAFDIDSFTVELLNAWFTRLGVDDRFTAGVHDLLAGQPVVADVTLLLKVLPPLELQERGASRRVLESLPSKFVVVSYPTKSVSGKEKGMASFYRDQFQQIADGQPWNITELAIGNELVFVIHK